MKIEKKSIQTINLRSLAEVLLAVSLDSLKIGVNEPMHGTMNLDYSEFNVKGYMISKQKL